MLIIYSIDIFITILLLFSTFCKPSKNIYLTGTLAIFIILLVTFTLKSPVTTDANGYFTLYKYYSINFYQELEKASEYFYLSNEVIFLILNYLSFKIFNNYFVLQLIFGFFLLFPVLYNIQKYSKNIYFSIILFVTIGDYFTSFNISRQIIACSICFYAFEYMVKGRLFKYILIILIASMIHKSSFIMILFYFLLRIRLNIYLTSLMISLFVLSVFSFGYNFILLTPYSHYADIFYNPSVNSFGNLLVPFVLIFLILFNIKKIKYTKYVDIILLNSTIYFILFKSFSIFFPFVDRISNYFSFYILLIIPQIIYNISSKFNKIIVYISFYVFCLLFQIISLGKTTYSLLDIIINEDLFDISNLQMFIQ